jgi:hypothetical protein
VKRPVLMKRHALVAVLGAAALLLTCSVAVAGPSLPQPQAGAWKLGDAPGGFTLAAGKGKKLFLTNVHTRTSNFVGCPDESEPITVSGRFPLKVIKLQGTYPVWGVGKPGVEKRYSDSNSGLVSIPAKVKVGGKPVPGGGIKMDFSYEDTTEFMLLIIEFGPKDESPCVTYAESAAHR